MICFPINGKYTNISQVFKQKPSLFLIVMCHHTSLVGKLINTVGLFVININMVKLTLMVFYKNHWWVLFTHACVLGIFSCVSWWYRTGIFKAIPKLFLYFFEAEEILGLTIAPWLSSSLDLLNLTKSSLAVLINVYFSSGVVLCSPYLFSNTSLRDLKNNHPGSQSFLPWLPG